MKTIEIVAAEGSSQSATTLDLGSHTVQFFVSPFLHWPDTMFSYVKEIKTLITCDFFGAHYCNEAVFSNKICTSKEAEKDMWDAYKYYFDCVRNSTLLKTYLQIFGPFKPYVLKGLDIVNSLPVENICCSHGPVLRDNLKKYIGKRKLLIVLIV